MNEATHRGFSPRQLAAMIVVLVVVAVAFMQGVSRRTVADQRTTTIMRLQRLQKALTDYAIDNSGMFPTARQGLDALVTQPSRAPLPPNWQGPYVDSAAELQDGWGYPFHYASPGNGDPPRCFDLWSNGADRAEGGEGPNADISSYNRETQLP